MLLVQHGIEKGWNSASRKQVRNDYGQYARFILPGTSVPTLLAPRMGGLFIEGPDTCDGLRRVHFHYEATACRNSGYTARKNLPSSRTRRNSGSFPLTGSRCWNSISV
jgi:hypothetical protein